MPFLDKGGQKCPHLNSTVLSKKTPKNSSKHFRLPQTVEYEPGTHVPPQSHPPLFVCTMVVCRWSMVFGGSVWFGERLPDLVPLVLSAECGYVLSDESVLVVGDDEGTGFSKRSRKDCRN
jgi:hypothetical protein